MRVIGQRLYIFIQNYQWWMQIWLPQGRYFTILEYAPTSISKCLLQFPLLPFTLLSYSKYLSVVTSQEGEGRPTSIFRLNVIPLNLLQWPQQGNSQHWLFPESEIQFLLPSHVANWEAAMPALGGRGEGRYALPVKDLQSKGTAVSPQILNTRI